MLLNWASCKRMLEDEVTARHPSRKFTRVQKDGLQSYLEGVLRGAIRTLAQRQAHRGKTISLENAGIRTADEENNENVE